MAALGDAVDPAVLVAVVFAVSLLAPFLFLVRMRNAERRRREPWSAVLGAFAWGALGATTLAYVIESYVLGIAPFPQAVYGLASLTVIVAPLVEEAAKALGLAFVPDRDPERHDGYIYGAAAGLGFAFVENLYYALATYVVGGLEAALVVAVFRAIATVCLHAAATALVGYGVWRLRFGGNPFPLLFYLPLAVLLHAAYNALAGLALLGAALAAALLAIVVYRRILRRVRVHSRRAP